MFNISNDMTSPKPGTKSLPLGTSIFVSVLVSLVSETVGDDDVLALPDDCIFGASSFNPSAFGASTFGTSTVISICISTGAGGGGSGGGGAGTVIGFIGLTGLIGLSTFVKFVIDF